jgi:hypothetical protein
VDIMPFCSHPAWRAGQPAWWATGRINQTEKKNEDSGNEGNYRGTDYIGKLGVEQSFEQQLHGTTGWSKSRRRSAARCATCHHRHTRQHRDAVAGHQAAKAGGGMFMTVGALVALTRAAVTCWPSANQRLTRTCGRIDTGKLEGAERVHRQTSSQRHCAAPTRLA